MSFTIRNVLKHFLKNISFQCLFLEAIFRQNEVTNTLSSYLAVMLNETGSVFSTLTPHGVVLSDSVVVIYEQNSTLLLCSSLVIPPASAQTSAQKDSSAQEGCLGSMGPCTLGMCSPPKQGKCLHGRKF